MTTAALSPATSMRNRLQQSTRGLHLSVERHFALDRAWTAAEYRHLLTRLIGIYAPLERALMRIDWRGSNLDAPGRCKCAWLRSDLAYLGLSPEAVAALPEYTGLPDLETAADGLGAFYVLEGATLGGRVILGALEPHLGISAMAGGRFFASYGAAVGLQWRKYLDVLEDFSATPAQADRIARCAVLIFQGFESWFSDTALERRNVSA